VGEKLGFLPAGMRRLAEIWRAPLPDYSSPGGGGSWLAQALWYVVSAFVGAAFLLAVLLAVRWVLARTERHAEPA
jgi:hypothetical protein